MLNEHCEFRETYSTEHQMMRMVEETMINMENRGAFIMYLAQVKAVEEV